MMALPKFAQLTGVMVASVLAYSGYPIDMRDLRQLGPGAAFTMNYEYLCGSILCM